MTKLTHIFFDIGSTLVDETECYNHRIRDMIAGTEITFEQFREKQELIGFDEAAKFFRIDENSVAFGGRTAFLRNKGDSSVSLR